MANFIYNQAKNRFLAWQSSGDPIDMIDDQIRVCVVGSGYVPDINEPDMDNVLVNIVGTPLNLSGKLISDGVFFADNVTFVSVTGGLIESLVVYKETGNPFTSIPIAFVDVVASGLPLTPNGGNIIVQWSPSGIFSL